MIPNQSTQPPTLISTPSPAGPPGPPPPSAVKTYTPSHHSPSGQQPAWHKFVFPGLTALILAAGLGIGVVLVSNQKQPQDVRAPAKVSPPRAKCGLEINTSESASAGSYSVNATVTYSGNQDQVSLTYFWTRCRCQQGGGNSTQSGQPICKGYWPSDPGECSASSEQTVTITKGASTTLSQSVSQHQNMDCGSYQLDLVVVDVSGEVCNQFIPAYGFYPTGTNCQLATPPPPSPPPQKACQESCSSTDPCASSLACLGGKCVNVSCPGDPDCVCPPPPSPPPKKACQATCAASSECDGSLICTDSKCVNAECSAELDCVCPGATPTPTAAPPTVKKEENLPGASGGYGFLRALFRFLFSQL